MAKLFDLITEEELIHCIDVWTNGMGQPKYRYLNEKFINQVKELLLQSESLPLMIEEAQAFRLNGKFDTNATLIDEVFNYLDKTLLH